MPKKMAKLDESPDFRPFKFRIQAFTNAFVEEVSYNPPLLSQFARLTSPDVSQLQRLGVLEEALSTKKIKSYLWTQNLISRYNDDGKKAKSKGNHIWMVNAKKLPDGSWVFKQFQRRILPVPAPSALPGSIYVWKPRVWDPQASTAGLKVEYTSPMGSLPSWLSWEGGVLTGKPEIGDRDAQVNVFASVSVSCLIRWASISVMRTDTATLPSLSSRIRTASNTNYSPTLMLKLSVQLGPARAYLRLSHWVYSATMLCRSILCPPTLDST